MELKSHVACGYISVFVLLSMCYLCDARPIDHPDIESNQNITDTKESLLNISRNNAPSKQTAVTHSAKQFVLPLPNISAIPKGTEILSVIINAAENNTVVQVRIPYINDKKTYLLKRNQVVKLNFTRKMLSLFNDSLNTIGRTIEETNGNMAKIQHTQSQQLQPYKSATIGLAVLCAVMFVALSLLTLRYRAATNTSKKPEDTTQEVAKQAVESEYQSIRGLPRRETGKSYVYETVKPRLPHPRPPIAHLLQPNEGEYENLKSHVRESNPYMPMDEALAGSGLTGNAVVLSGGDEDLYLTMKKLVRTPEDTAVETNEL